MVGGFVVWPLVVGGGGCWWDVLPEGSAGGVRGCVDGAPVGWD